MRKMEKHSALSSMQTSHYLCAIPTKANPVKTPSAEPMRLKDLKTPTQRHSAMRKPEMAKNARNAVPPAVESDAGEAGETLPTVVENDNKRLA